MLLFAFLGFLLRHGDILNMPQLWRGPSIATIERCFRRRLAVVRNWAAKVVKTAETIFPAECPRQYDVQIPDSGLISFLRKNFIILVVSLYLTLFHPLSPSLFKVWVVSWKLVPTNWAGTMSMQPADDTIGMIHMTAW
jgi:hypothetical protein